MECSVSTKNEYEHSADVHYHHDCWLGVTIKDIAAAWENMSNTIEVQQTAQIVGYCYNKFEY